MHFINNTAQVNLKIPCYNYKSQSERRIAGFLTKHSIPFIYEDIISFIEDGKYNIFYPSFRLPSGLLIEYFGRDRHTDSGEQPQCKLELYIRNYICVIPFYSADFQGKWERKLLQKIKSVSLYQCIRDYIGNHNPSVSTPMDRS